MWVDDKYHSCLGHFRLNYISYKYVLLTDISNILLKTDKIVKINFWNCEKCSIYFFFIVTVNQKACKRIKCLNRYLEIWNEEAKNVNERKKKNTRYFDGVIYAKNSSRFFHQRKLDLVFVFPILQFLYFLFTIARKHICLFTT